MNAQFIHPTAIVSSEVELGENVHVGPFSILSRIGSLGEISARFLLYPARSCPEPVYLKQVSGP